MDILAQAFALGLVTRREVERGLVTGRPGAVRGQVSITVRGRVVAMVREADAWSWAQRTRTVLAVLSDEDLGPAILPSVDGRLWTAPVPGRCLAELADVADAPPAVSGSNLAELTAACVALGAALAGVHRLPARHDLSSVPPSPPPSALGHVRQARGTALGAEILHAVDTDRGIQVAAETVRQRWSERNWTIGRIDPDSVVVDAFWRARFADVDSAGLGNPDWDVAACLASIAVLADSKAASVAWLSEHFWNSYRRAGGPGRVHPQMQAMYAIDAAWRAVDPALAGDDVAEDVHWWLDRAHRLVARPTLPGLAA